MEKETVMNELEDLWASVRNLETDISSLAQTTSELSIRLRSLEEAVKDGFKRVDCHHDDLSEIKSVVRVLDTHYRDMKDVISDLISKMEGIRQTLADFITDTAPKYVKKEDIILYMMIFGGFFSAVQFIISMIK